MAEPWCRLVEELVLQEECQDVLSEECYDVPSQHCALTYTEAEFLLDISHISLSNAI